MFHKIWEWIKGLFHKDDDITYPTLGFSGGINVNMTVIAKLGFGMLGLGLLVILIPCSSQATPAPAQATPTASAAGPFEKADVFKTLPKGAKLVTRAEHEKLLQNHEAFLISLSERNRLAKVEAARFAERQKAAHAALGNDPKAIAELNAIRESDVEGKINTLTGTKTFLELGRRDIIEMIASSAELPSNRVNAHEAYRFAYELLPSIDRGKFTIPDKIDSFTLMRIKQDTASMMKIASALNQHTTKRASSNAVEYEPRNDGQDKDTAQRCIDRGFDPNGLMSKFDFALKPHLGRARVQSGRSTCWAFAAVAATEANAHKNTTQWHNLSEQDLVMHHKLIWNRAANDFPEGGSSGTVLTKAFENQYRFAVESQLEYNPVLSRVTYANAAPPRYERSCDNYGQDCSDTNHEAPMICTQFGTELQWCSYRTLPLHRTTFVSRRVTNIWDPADQDGSLQNLRTTLESGTPVILGFTTTASWRGITPADPYLNLPASPEAKLGGHYVLAVGYIPREAVAAAGIPPDLLDGVDDDWIIIKNSYGRCWGDAGYAYIPATQLKRIHAIQNSSGSRIGVVELFVVPRAVTL
jgi:C1A family cysteine protease